MSVQLQERIYDQLDSVVLIDSHSHIDPLNPVARTLADIVGYHYYTELAHSSGMPRERIEEPGISPREKVSRLFEYLGNIDNTIQWSWFIELVRELLGFDGITIDRNNWEQVYDLAETKFSETDWESTVLKRSKIERIFLTNDFDDPLIGFDTDRYVPCLRTDELVFQLANERVLERLERTAGRAIGDLGGLHEAIGRLFDRFCHRGARACAISLPPQFNPTKPSRQLAEGAFLDLLKHRSTASEENIQHVAGWVFWTLAEYCSDCKLPFDLMIGVNRRVYRSGVHQGQDLFDSRVSLIQYAELFNSFPDVKFPISVLASVTNQELIDYAWIFPNVITHGHWWYSNTPNFITHDLRGRLEAVPRNKQIGYYSDAYKLEFVLPKYRMYKRILAKVIAETVCLDHAMSEEKGIELGRQILRGNVETIFGFNSEPG